MFVYKPIKSTALNKTHIAHKSWTATDETANTLGVVSYSGHYSRGEWSIGDAGSANVGLEALTTNGYYKREIFDSIYHLYYTDVENAMKSGDAEYLSQQTRDLNSRIHVVSIPSNIFGKRLKEHSFTMSSARATVYDDGVGNLRDSKIAALTSPSFKNFTKSDYILKCDFNDGWKFQTSNPSVEYTYVTSTSRLIDISDGPFVPIGTNITFGKFTSGEWGRNNQTFISLHGSQSIESESNSIVRIENSLILGANERRWDSDFALSLWVKAPLSQSVTSSFQGGWRPTTTRFGGTSNRLLVDHTHNVITTSRQKNYICPWELQIYNSSDATNKGKLRFLRGRGGSFSAITSSAINDDSWHHVVLQVATGSLQLWMDGTLQESQKVDPSANEAIYDDTSDIYIGARKYLGLEFKTQVKDSPGFVKGVENFVYPFKGDINQYRLFNKALTTDEILSLKTYYRDSDIVGNVFYNHGIAVITDLSGSYDALIDDYTLQFQGTTEHTIHNYQCIVEDEEYNVTFNPSARVNQDKNNPRLQGFATSSEFTPYITNIGLYNDKHELLAVSKLATPVKSPTDLDIVFNVQFDT